MADTPTQPLHIDRAKLIARLQERKAEEETKRQEAQDAITSRRKAAEDAVTSLSGDELLNLVQKYVDSNLDHIVEMVKDAKETGRLKSAEQKPNSVETAIEKWLRVFEMSNDKEVEVQPSDSVYNLL